MFLALAATIAAGLGSRAAAGALPDFVRLYAGDTLWASAAYFLIAACLPASPRASVTGFALVLSVLVEISQLYHAPWIDAVRATRPGGWILGFGFLWSDLVCYAAGVAIALVLDLMLTRPARAALIDRP